MKVTCPNCGSDDIRTTCLGRITGRNINAAECGKCAYRGTYADWEEIGELRKSLDKCKLPEGQPDLPPIPASKLHSKVEVTEQQIKMYKEKKK
jgi:hypothetical protein